MLNRYTHADATKYSFKTSWYDKVADKDRDYIVTVYVETKEIEIMDVFNNRVFLRRSPYPELNISDFVVGTVITIHGRQHNIIDFANEFSRKQLSQLFERTCAIIKPHAYARDPRVLQQVMARIQQVGLQVTRLQISRFTEQAARSFYAEHVSKPFFPQLFDMVTEGPAVFIELTGENAVPKWRELIGATNPEQADPGTLRKQYGEDVTRNAFHGSASPAEAENELKIAFALRPIQSPTPNTAVIVVSPWFKDQFAAILDQLFQQVNSYQNIKISGIHAGIPTALDVEEIMKAYQGVLPNWADYCDHLDDGVCIAIELEGNEHVVNVARQICGPFDPEIARLLNPSSIRAIFGKNVVDNCVFVTDIPEEAALHSEFWFKVLE